MPKRIGGIMVGDESFVLNNMWNTKVDQTRAKIVELQALLKYLGLEKIELSDIGKEYPVDDILKALFVRVIGKTKAI